MKKLRLASFCLCIVSTGLFSQGFSYKVQAYISGGGFNADTLLESASPAQGTLLSSLDYAASPYWATLEQYCEPTGKAGIATGVRGGAGFKLESSGAVRFNNPAAYFEGINGQSVPVEFFFSLDGQEKLETFKTNGNYCVGGAEARLYCNLTLERAGSQLGRFYLSSDLGMSGNRLNCLACYTDSSYNYEIVLKPKFIVNQNTAIHLTPSLTDSLVNFYQTLTTEQISTNNLSMSANFLAMLDTFTYKRLDFFTLPWIQTSTGTTSYGAFERLFYYSGYHQQYGLSPLTDTLSFCMDYQINFDVQRSFSFDATSDSIQMEYLFYNTMTSKTPCEKQLEGDFMNTLQIDSIRVQPGYVNPAVNFDDLYFVVAPGVKIKVKHDVLSGVKNNFDRETVFNISPNPAGDWVLVNIQNEDFQGVYYRLFDLNGQILQQEKITGSSFKVLRRNNSPGIYLIEITDKDGSIARKKMIWR